MHSQINKQVCFVDGSWIDVVNSSIIHNSEEILDNPEERLKFIREQFIKGMPLEREHYEYIFSWLVNYTEHNDGSEITEECKLALIRIISNIYKTILINGTPPHLDAFLNEKMPYTNKGVLQSLSVIEDKFLCGNNDSRYFKSLVEVAQILVLKEPTAKNICLNNILFNELRYLQCFLHKAIASDIEIKYQRKVQHLKHEGQVFKAITEMDQNVYPIVFGKPEVAPYTVSYASVYLGNIDSEEAIVILKETGVGQASISQNIENIAKAFYEQFLSHIPSNKIAWYEITKGFDKAIGIDLINFDSIDGSSFLHPNWLRIESSHFDYMYDSLEPMLLNL